MITKTAVTVSLLAVLTAGHPGTARPNAQDQVFLRTAHQGNLAEISAARIAQQRGTTSGVRDLATRWISDHTSADRSLVQAAIALDVVLPAAPTPAQEALTARYRNAPDAEFDPLWVSTQVTEHQRAASLVTAELTAGASPTVTALAHSAGPMISTHLRLLTALEPAVGAAIPARPDVPRPGSAPLPPPAAPPADQSSVAPVRETPGWTQPRANTAIPIPGGPWPSTTAAP
ncbi:DUF4142 domain-containing protein [Cryptosporangium sp. NPDC051539]|uniref:DUF4142 domain-containing protein n=1 Tax=Cryptosporangium sp. NPDC051539 TaxID=3363962 RepID=UPI00379B4147